MRLPCLLGVFAPLGTVIAAPVFIFFFHISVDQVVLRLGRRAGCSPIWAELPFKGFPTSEKMPPSPYVERAPFGSYPKAFELLKGHLAVSLRTQTSAFGRMRELPSRAVRENTDRQSSSLGCKIRQNIHPKTDRNDAKSCHNDATSCHVAEKRYKYRHFIVYLHRQTKRRQTICRLVG